MLTDTANNFLEGMIKLMYLVLGAKLYLPGLKKTGYIINKNVAEEMYKKHNKFPSSLR